MSESLSYDTKIRIRAGAYVLYNFRYFGIIKRKLLSGAGG